MDLDRIQKRQVARLIDHLKSIGYDRPEIFAAIKRSYGYAFEDIKVVLGTEETRMKRQGENANADD